MRRFIVIPILVCMMVSVGLSIILAPGPAWAACGSSTTTPALGLIKIANAKNWWECLDDNVDVLDTRLAVEYVSSTATSGAATTLTDTTQDWSTDLWKDRVVKITGGTGSGQDRSISSNTATVLTVSSAWTTNPDATSTYKVLGGSGGVTDHGALTGLTDDDHTQYVLADGTRAMTGDLTLPGDPNADLEAATKQYVDAVKVGAIAFIIDGGGSAITTGVKGDLRIPFGCTINRVTALADQSTTSVIDIWKDTYANFPPTDADSITASAPVTITTATKSEDSTLTGWTTGITADDILRWNVDSNDNATRITVNAKCTKS